MDYGVEGKRVNGIFKRLGCVPYGLRDAVNATVGLRRGIAAVRDAMRVVDSGNLFIHIESWYVKKHNAFDLLKYPQSLVERNPYAKFKAGFSKSEHARWSQELDFLLDEVPKSTPMPNNDHMIGPGEVSTLMEDLSYPDGKLARIITVCPYLTHEDNVHIATLDARLWLSSSELPLEIVEGSPSYKAIRWDGAPAERKMRLKHPSFWDVHRKNVARNSHWTEHYPRTEIYHVSPSDFEDPGCFMARMARLGMTVPSSPNDDKRQIAASLMPRVAEDDIESKDVFIEMARVTETDEMFEILVHRLFGS